jgi:hypothetical protein
MPTSRKRKIDNSRRKKKPNPHPFYRDKQTLRLKSKVFNLLRENEDFIALVRIGRVLNVLDYSDQLITNPPLSIPEQVQPHHRVRTLFNTAGYLAEGLQVVQSLRLKYSNSDFFKPLLELFDESYERKRAVVREIRNSAFHLDHEAKATPTTLRELKLPHYDFYSEAKGEIKSAYFHLPDLVDFNFVMDKLMPNRSDRAAVTELFEMILSFNVSFRKAAWVFITGVANRLNLTV